MAAKVITVFGATGQQGGSVVRALVKDKQYCVRAITRNPDSDKSKALKAQGCEVVKGDFDDKKSLVEATKGAYGVFLVTNFFGTMSQDGEANQGKVAVDACKQNNVKHLVFSGLEPCKKEIGVEVAHFDSKAEVEDYIVEQKVPFTMVRMAFYMENFIGMGMGPEKQDDGTFKLNIPMADVPVDLVAINNCGEPVHAIFNNPQEYLGKKVGLSGGKYTIEDIAKLMSKHCAPAVIKDGKISLDAYRSLPFPLAEEMGNMFEYYQRGKFSRDPVLTRKLDPKNPDLEQWIIENKEALRKQVGL